HTGTDYVFPSERYGGAGDSFTACTYDSDPNKPIGRWKEAWEAAKLRTGIRCRFHDLRPHGMYPHARGWSSVLSRTRDHGMASAHHGTNGKTLWPYRPERPEAGSSTAQRCEFRHHGGTKVGTIGERCDFEIGELIENAG